MPAPKQPRVVAVVGATGVGKSRLAIRLAQSCRGEIVNADSRQVYRYLDIGTAKPSPGDLTLVPHHLISIIDPDEDFSLARYQEFALAAIKDIHERGKLPIVVGGSGQYVWSLLEGWQTPRVAPDPQFRRSLEARAAAGEGPALYRQLETVDPDSARKINSRNVRRVIRALEVCHSTGRPASSQRGKKAPAFDSLVIGLTCARTELYQRIDERIDRMIECGLVDEAKRLISLGYRLDLPSMSGIGYPQMGDYLAGKLTLDEAVAQMKRATRRFVRHQYGWFRLDDPRIHWFGVQKEPEAEILSLVMRFATSE